MARKPKIDNIADVVSKAAEDRESEWEDKYTDFVLWVVKTLNPASFLPPISDEAYARKLIEALVSSESKLQQEIKLKERKWNDERKELLEEQKEFKKRIKNLEQKNKEIIDELNDLKEDLKDHGEELLDSVEEKTFLDRLKGFSNKVFKRK